jgi:hypothetical protein
MPRRHFPPGVRVDWWNVRRSDESDLAGWTNDGFGQKPCGRWRLGQKSLRRSSPTPTAARDGGVSHGSRLMSDPEVGRESYVLT